MKVAILDTAVTTRARWALALTLGVMYATLGVARDGVNVLRASGWLGVVVTAAFVTAAVVVLVLALRDSARPLRAVAALLMCCIPYIAVMPLMYTPEERLHLIEYGVVALLAFAAFPQRAALRHYGQTLLFVLAAGWLDEGIQALLPSRRYDLRDVAFNVAAGALALGTLAVFQRVR